MKTVNTDIARATLIKRLDEHLQQVRQWAASKDYTRAAHYQAKAEAIIEILKADGCGSVSGYDRLREQQRMPCGQNGSQRAATGSQA